MYIEHIKERQKGAGPSWIYFNERKDEMTCSFQYYLQVISSHSSYKNTFKERLGFPCYLYQLSLFSLHNFHSCQISNTIGQFIF
jgi:hypothetical protein